MNIIATLQGKGLFHRTLQPLYLTMRGKSILIVDDSPLITDRLQIMLNSMENISFVNTAGDYPSALHRLTESLTDIVLLDINLPGRSGIDLLRHIKANYPHTIVIMLSNQAGEYYRTICKRLGAEYFIDKSREFEQVPTVIASTL